MPHLHARPLHVGPLLQIADVTCCAPMSPRGPEEWPNSHHLAIPRTGVFVRHQGKRDIVGEVTTAMFFNRGESYRVSHPVSGGDACTTFHCGDATWSELVAPYDNTAAERPTAPFAFADAPLSTAVLLRYHRLRRAIIAGVADQLYVEEAALGLLSGAIHAAYAARSVQASGKRGETQRARRDMAEHAKLILATDPGRRISLGELARAVRSSPFHLTRVFREQVGVPVHQHLLRLRLAVALDRLAAGESLSTIAHALGFSSHSHFTAVFRRAFSMKPSEYRLAPWA